MAAHRLTGTVPLTPRPAVAATAAVFDREPVGEQIPAPHLRKRLPAPLMRKYLSYDVEEMAGLLRGHGFTVISLGINRRGREAALSVMGDPFSPVYEVATVWLHSKGRIVWDTAFETFQVPADTARERAAASIAASLRRAGPHASRA